MQGAQFEPKAAGVKRRETAPSEDRLLGMIEAAKAIRCVLCDIDGVLTQGDLTYSAAGQIQKTFHAQDGAMLKFARQAGLQVGLLSGRASEAAAMRAQELGLECCLLGVADKVAALEQWAASQELSVKEIAYIGDDLPDIGIMAAVGWSAAVADACPLLLRHCDFIAQRRGGQAAVAEILRWLLQLQGRLTLDAGLEAGHG